MALSQQPLIVGIAGGTGSGKSTLARWLVRHFGDLALPLASDHYYRTAPPDVDIEQYDFDEPAAIEFSLLAEHLRTLRAGGAVERPQYDFAHHRRTSVTTTLTPTPLIIVEGILVLAVPEVRAQLDLSFFVSATADYRLARRIRRDITTRGRTVDEVLDQYQATVQRAHDRHVEPSRVHADLIVPNQAPLPGWKDGGVVPVGIAMPTGFRLVGLAIEGALRERGVIG